MNKNCVCFKLDIRGCDRFNTRQLHLSHMEDSVEKINDFWAVGKCTKDDCAVLWTLMLEQPIKFI